MKPRNQLYSKCFRYFLGAVLCLVLNWTFTTSAQTNIQFTDGFEAPTFDPFWNIPTVVGGSIILSSAQAQSGNQSAQVMWNAAPPGGFHSLDIGHTFSDLS